MLMGVRDGNQDVGCTAQRAAHRGLAGQAAAAQIAWPAPAHFQLMCCPRALPNPVPSLPLPFAAVQDQCRREMAAGRVFRGLREGGPLAFRPTYKFDKASANPFAYDTSEKRRIPAWCDRIFFRGSAPFPTPEVRRAPLPARRAGAAQQRRLEVWQPGTQTGWAACSACSWCALRSVATVACWPRGRRPRRGRGCGAGGCDTARSGCTLTGLPPGRPGPPAAGGGGRAGAGGG